MALDNAISKEVARPGIMSEVAGDASPSPAQLVCASSTARPKRNGEPTPFRFEGN
jgi:hypothetical protein